MTCRVALVLSIPEKKHWHDGILIRRGLKAILRPALLFVYRRERVEQSEPSREKNRARLAVLIVTEPRADSHDICTCLQSAAPRRQRGFFHVGSHLFHQSGGGRCQIMFLMEHQAQGADQCGGL